MDYLHNAETSSLYIHWPFCPYRCFYCPFIAIAGQDQYMEQYHNALVCEIKNSIKKGSFPLIKTLYFGGGTPSTYPLPLLLDMFAILRQVFSFAPDIEITFEVNPGTVTEEHLKVWKELGINRVSIGVQSFNEKALVDVNRHQKVSDVLRLLESVFSYISNVSVDIILGLPGVSDSDWKFMVSSLVAYPITHISMYILEVHDTTQLFFKLRKGELKLPNEENMIDLFYWSRDFLTKEGFCQYEISNFSRNGNFSRHNTAYWDRKLFRGFGLGAWSFDGTKRIQNEKNLILYCTKAIAGSKIAVEVDTISDEQKHIETIMLGLRRNTGLLYDQICSGDETMKAKKRESIKMLIQEGLVVKTDDNKIVLTAKGLIVENRIASEII